MVLTKTKTEELVISPANILQTGLGFWSSKLLLTAVKLRLFTLLSESSQTAEQIKTQLDLQDRGLYDFLDGLVALQFLHREGTGANATYFNTLDTAAFLDRNKPAYIGGILEMADSRLYPFWNNLEEALKTGKPQNEVKTGQKPLFEEIYSDEKRLEEFVAAMAGAQMGNFIAFAQTFNFREYETHCDIGGAGGHLSAQVAIHNPHIRSLTFDLPVVAPIAQKHVDALGLHNRVSIAAGDFFADPFPQADIITMGNILHDWNLETKKMLIRKAYDALPEGGALAVIENVIDDERKENVFGMLMSLNMLIETDGGFDYTAKEFITWAKEAGFKSMEVIHLTGPSSVLVAYK